MNLSPKAITDFQQTMWQFSDVYSDIELLRQKPMTLDVTLGAAHDCYLVIPIDCSIVKIYSVIYGSLSNADETLSFYDNDATELTGSSITITQSGSAAGDIDTSTPTSNNRFEAGDVLKIAVGGENSTHIRCEVTIL